MSRLAQNSIDTFLQTSTWQQIGDELTIACCFPSFMETISCIQQIATIAEELNHHPTFVNTYNRLQVTISTHDIGGISDLDLRFATLVESCLRAMPHIAFVEPAKP